MALSFCYKNTVWFPCFILLRFVNPETIYDINLLRREREKKSDKYYKKKVLNLLYVTVYISYILLLLYYLYLISFLLRQYLTVLALPSLFKLILGSYYFFISF